jgi:hypothetical protein
MFDDITEAQQEAITNFSLNFGLAWYLVSEYKKEYAISHEIKLQKTTMMDAFLEKEMARLHLGDKISTLEAVVHAHLLEAQKKLLSFTMESDQVRYFVEEQLVPITGIDAMKNFKN